MIDITELETVRRICRHHHADTPALVSDLARLIEWVHQAEQARHGGPPPALLLSLETALGLHRTADAGIRLNPPALTARHR